MSKTEEFHILEENHAIQHIDGINIEVSNLDKYYFPADKITKGEVIEYYQEIAQVLLPHLKDRPQSMKRNPNGIADEGFYQKDAGPHIPSWIKTVGFFSGWSQRNVDYIICNDRATLAYMNNLGCIEINPWNSSFKKPDHPLFLVIDIDPSEINSFDDVVEVTLAVKEVLDKAEADACCKTSGASGMHVYIPLGAKYTYEEAMPLARLIAGHTHQLLPQKTTLERRIQNRGNKVYIDFLQNHQGQTLSSVYSIRPRPGAPVSCPLHWKEVKPGMRPEHFHMKNMLRRLEKEGDLFMPTLEKGINLKKVLRALE